MPTITALPDPAEVRAALSGRALMLYAAGETPPGLHRLATPEQLQSLLLEALRGAGRLIDAEDLYHTVYTVPGVALHVDGDQFEFMEMLHCTENALGQLMLAGLAICTLGEEWCLETPRWALR